MSDQTEMTWRGERILHVPYTVQPFNKCDAWGFTIEKAFVVRDDFDEPSLPLAEQWFWSPGEAVAAIEMKHIIAPEIKGPKWPTTVTYEYHQMTAYRRNFDAVYFALIKIGKACKDSRDFDENPRDEIEKILQMLKVQVSESRRVA